MSIHSYKKRPKKRRTIAVPKDDWSFRTASVFKILADSTRCRIIEFLIEASEGKCVYEIAEHVGITHSAASHQLTRLETRGVLTCTREGQTMCYQMSGSDLAKNLTKILSIVT